MARPSPVVSLAALLVAASIAHAQQPATPAVQRATSTLRVIAPKASGPGGSSVVSGRLIRTLNSADGDTISAVQDPAVQDPAAAAAQQEAQEKAQAQQRMQAFQQANFDRRHSSILAAWAKPEPLAPDEDPELQLPEPDPEASKPPQPPQPTAPPTAPERDTPPMDPSELPAWEAEQAAAQAAYEVAMKAHQDAQAKAQAEFQKQMAAFQQAQQEQAQKTAQLQAKRLARDVEIFIRHITLGRWDALSAILGGIDEKQAPALYKAILQKLAQPQPQTQNGSLRQFQEENVFSFEDILQLIAIAPPSKDKDGEPIDGFDKSNNPLLVPLIQRCFALGNTFEDWLVALRSELARPEGERRVDDRGAARLLTAQNRDDTTAEFLPTLAELEAQGAGELDREGLNLLARHFHALYRKDRKVEALKDAWTATLAALAPGEIEDEQKTEALKRAVELAPNVAKLGLEGANWLDESFAQRPERGMEALATIGAEASRGMIDHPNDPDSRLATIQLLRSAVESLLEKAPERADEWRPTLNLLADVWLREAKHSYQYSQASQMGPVAQRDSWGNIYWNDYGRNYRNTQVQTLAPSELLELRPDGRWRDLLYDSVRPEYDSTVAELYLKVSEEALAFPYIERLAAAGHQDSANELAKEFLNVWTRNNDPNAARNRTNIYNFSYGFNNRASGIPLTRSKQERSLRDLAEWVDRLRGIEGVELDSKLLVRAFTGCHSQAEVYRIETMEAVFGTLEDLDAATLADMSQTMRANLGNMWRVPAVQQQAGTNRKQKQIEAMVMQGYNLAQTVLNRAIKAHPGAWQLVVARAAMIHDLNNYRNEIKKTSEFSATRKKALTLFEQAVADYAVAAEDLRTDEYSVTAMEGWFYAALGASDLAAVDQNTVLAGAEIPKIKAAFDAMPGALGDTHRSMFANSLFTRLSAVNPSVKNRYLECGFAIVGDHPQAREARKVYDYYNDLVTEIQVRTLVDGDRDVGTEPFGVKVELRYTDQIGQESGGFGKYLQNQLNNVNPYYNSGRPPENYRDKFDESVRTALGEHFDVLSVTFNREDASPLAMQKVGWKRMNYAYLLLKAKGPQVDRIPPIKLDLDFNDVSGYVVLPISSPVVTIDASAAGDTRPFENLQVTQVLDQRRIEEGELSLEIKAQADGLVPDLEQVVELKPADFVVDEVVDQEVSVTRFADNDDAVVTERMWLVKFKAKEGAQNPDTFRFATPVAEGTQVIYQTYDDADLATAGSEIKLARTLAPEAGFPWLWLVLGAIAILVLWILKRAMTKGSTVQAEQGLKVPERITPFSVLTVLREVRTRPTLADGQRQELDTTIGTIERYYFGAENGSATAEPDLSRIAQDWVQRA